MALFRLEAKIFSREKRGRSVIAASAYRSGSRIRDEKNGIVFDYKRRSKGVIESIILQPANAPEWVGNPEQLWNRVEAGEKRSDAQLAREFILAVPPEISAKEQFELAVGWAQSELVSRGMIAEISLHHPKGGNNPHVHILTTMRNLDGDKFSAKKPREWNDKALLIHWRESWANAVNSSLEKAGRPERVTHLSLEAQGIDRIPEPKKGVAATAMKRRGFLDEPMKFLSIADWTGIIETELFAKTYRSYGLATVRYPVLEIEARVEPFENGRGFTLRALAARGPRRT